MAAGAKLNPRVRTLEQALELSLPAVKDAAEIADSIYRKQEIDIFATEGAIGGPRWVPLSRKYARWKAKRYPGRKILTLTGDMRDAFTLRASANHVVNVYRVSGWRIQLGAQGPRHWGYHSKGGRISGRPPIRDQQQRREEQALALTRAVSRGLVPHVLRNLRLRLGAVRVATY